MIDMDIAIPLRTTRHKQGHKQGHGHTTRHDWAARWTTVRVGSRSWPQGSTRASDGDKAGGGGDPLGPYIGSGALYVRGSQNPNIPQIPNQD